jgi:uncharacterized protein (DUF58 family)
VIFSRRFLILFALGALPLALLWPSPSARWTLILYDLILIALAFWDHHRAGDGTQFEVARRLPRRMMIAAENEVRIVVRARREQTLLIKDEYPPELELRGERLLRIRTGRGEATTGYRLFAAARGDYQFGDVVGRWSTPWGLAVRQARFQLSEHVRIYPNIHEAQKYELQARSNRLLAAGRRRTRIRGQGKEFESLREYVRGDELRHVSWTATARRGRLMTRQYQIERNQSIMIMLDAGRLMTSRIENLAKLDHAINAALAIGYVATRGGDNVGLLVFNREVQTYLPPQRGTGQMRALIEALYNVRAQMIEPSYGRAFQYLAQRCKRRSLVIILTDLVDRDASTELLAHTASLLPRHLPLIVTIGDKDLGALLTEPPHAAGDVYRQSVAEELIAQREEALARITELGGLALDVPAGQLALELVNEYIEVKERGLL